MTLSYLLLVLRARWRASILVLCTVFGLALLASFLITPQYTATAAVVLDVKSPDPIAGIVLPGMTVSGYMGTQVDVLQSERVALRALRALKLDQDAEMQARWREATGGDGDMLAWLAETLQRKLDVKPSRESNVITVAFTSPDRNLSAAVANAIVRAYVETTLELRVDPARQYNSFFDGRAKQLRDAVEQAQTRLSIYQREHGIVATDERLDVENARLNELSTQYVLAQSAAGESSSRAGQVGPNGDRMAEVLNNPVVITLTAELGRQEARLGELTSRYGDQYPPIIELRANIAQLRTRIDAESRRVTGSVAVNNNVNQSRVAQLAAALEAQRNKVLMLKSQRDEAGVLLRDVDNAKRSYDLVMDRFNQSNIESQNTQTNVSVLKTATPPSAPSSPRTVLNAAVGLLIGLLLGVVTAMVRELRDQRLRTEHDVAVTMGVPVLGVLADRPRRGAAERGSRAGLIGGRVLGLLPPAAR